MAAPAQFPIQLAAEYDERRSRLAAALRLPLSIPVLLFASLLQSGVVPAIWAAILITGHIPRWLFDFQVALTRWQLRALSYFLLLTDRYPPFEGDYSISYDVRYPRRPSRWRLWIWKSVTSIAHFAVLAALFLTLLVLVPIAWFAIVFTGRFPSWLHSYVAGVLRWAARVQGYFLSLTDEFPPFALSADAGAGGSTAYVISSTIGVLTVAGVAGFVSVLLILRLGDITEGISYERLLSGELRDAETRIQVDSAEDQFESSVATGTVELTAAADPADALVPLLNAQSGHRLVQFELVMENQTYQELESDQSSFRLKDEEGGTHRPLLTVVGGRTRSWEVEQGESATALIVFELEEGLDPVEFRFNIGHHVHRSVIYLLR